MAAVAQSAPAARSPVATVFAAIGGALTLLFAAREVSAAFEAHRRPDPHALEVLGIDPAWLPADL